MLELILGTFLAFSCPETKIINNTDIWTAKDQQILDRNKTSCRRHYSDNPCLIRFEKVEHLFYRVTCGKEIK